MNAPSLSQSDEEVRVAIERLKAAGKSRCYDIAGNFKLLVNNATKNIYVYNFCQSVPASSLDKRKPPLFMMEDDMVETDEILRPTKTCYMKINYAVSSNLDKSPAKPIYDSPQDMELLGEVALNNIYVKELSPVLKQRGCIVTGNKSIVEEHSPLPISLCSSSKPDVLAFNPAQNVIIMIYRALDECSIGEEVQGFMTENKAKDGPSLQQLLGGAEKATGEMAVRHVHAYPHDPIFGYVTIYAFSIEHLTNKVVVRKISANYKNGSTKLERGKTPLTVVDATNRVIPYLSSP